MNRDEIYDHLAQVYIGKRKEIEKKKKKQFNAWLLINILITLIIFSSVAYGLTAFLTQKKTFLRSNVIFSLHQGLIRVEYDFKGGFSTVKTFDLSIPQMDAGKYDKIQFFIRGKEEGSPGVVKILLRTQRNEESVYYVSNVGLEWQKVSIPLRKFHKITDWTNLTSISFVFEAWNVEDEKGVVLIEDINFSS